MEKAYYPSKIKTYAELLEFVHSLNYDLLEISSINISFTAKIDENKKEEVSIEEIVDISAKADFD